MLTALISHTARRKNMNGQITGMVVPIAFVAFGIFANRLGRPDNDSTPLRNYFAVATSVILMSLGTAISDLSLSGKLNGEILAWILGFNFLLFVSIDFDRYGSWIRDNSGNPTNKKSIVIGILAPIVVAVAAYYFYRTTT